MAAMSDYLEKAILDHILKNTSFTSPTNVYIALFDSTGTGLEAGVLTGEISGTGYQRKICAFDLAAGDGSGHTQNTADVNFDTAGAGGWGTIEYVAIMDGDVEGGGNVLFHGALSTPKPVAEGDTFKFLLGDLDVYLA